MTNQWANLSNQQKNEYGKNFAKSEFIKNGFKIKDAPRDSGHIDFVAENTDAAYDVVVKTVSDFNYQYIVDSKFRNSSQFIVALVRILEDEDALLYIFRGDQWPSPDGLLTYKSNKNKDYEAEYGINLAKKRESILSNYALSSNLTKTGSDSDSDAAINSTASTEAGYNEIVNDLDSKNAFIAEGSLVDIRIGRIRSDFDVSVHGKEMSFYDRDPVLFEAKEKNIIDDSFRDSGNILVFGFDEPFDGLIINLTNLENGEAEKKQFEENFQEDFSRHIENWIYKNITDSILIADAISNLLKASWGFDFDPDDIQEEALDQLEGIKYMVAFSGGEFLYAEDSLFAGGVLLEINVFDAIPCDVSADKSIVFKGEHDDSFGDWDDYRDEEKRFIICFNVDK